MKDFYQVDEFAKIVEKAHLRSASGHAWAALKPESGIRPGSLSGLGSQLTHELLRYQRSGLLCGDEAGELIATGALRGPFVEPLELRGRGSLWTSPEDAFKGVGLHAWV